MKVIATFVIFPISVFVNIVLQRKFPNIIGGPTLRGALFDLVWYAGTSLGFVYLT
jgi:hypothetical protein